MAFGHGATTAPPDNPGCISPLNNFEQSKTQILDRVDIVDLISQYVSLKRRGKRWVGLCPFHQEKTPSFTVSPERSAFKCFGCGLGGDVFTFVQQHENVTFVEAMQILADRVGVDLGAPTGGSSGGIGRAEVAKVNLWALGFFRSVLLDKSLGRETRAYLANRGINEDVSARFDIGLSTANMPSLVRSASRAGFDESLLLEADLIRKSDDGRSYDTYRERLIFPIRDATKRVIGFGGRTLVDDRAKYLNTRQNMLFDKGRGLYGIDLARSRMSEAKRAVLVEGYTDCIAAHQAGFSETVATLGTALTESQVDLLRRYCDEVVLLFDSDIAGDKAADRAIQVALPRYLTVRLARIPDGKDPCEFMLGRSPAEFLDVLDRSVDALEFKWSRTQLRYQDNQPDSRRREAVLDFVRLVAQACSTGAVDAIQRGLLVNRIAKLVGQDSRDIHDLMVREGRGLSSRRSRSSVPSLSRGSSVSSGAEQAAWANLLGVLISEPGLASLADDLPGIDRIADPRDRRIAEQVLGLISQVGEFRLTEVLACCHEPGDAERITELVGKAADRGNHEETLKTALTRIRGGSQFSVFEDARRQAMGLEGKDSNETSRALETIHGSLTERRHFAPRRMVRQVENNGSTHSSGYSENA